MILYAEVLSEVYSVFYSTFVVIFAVKQAEVLIYDISCV
jgi:hypothetical protein